MASPKTIAENNGLVREFLDAIYKTVGYTPALTFLKDTLEKVVCKYSVHEMKDFNRILTSTMMELFTDAYPWQTYTLINTHGMPLNLDVDPKPTDDTPAKGKHKHGVEPEPAESDSEETAATAPKAFHAKAYSDNSMNKEINEMINEDGFATSDAAPPLELYHALQKQFEDDVIENVWPNKFWDGACLLTFMHSMVVWDSAYFNGDHFKKQAKILHMRFGSLPVWGTARKRKLWRKLRELCNKYRLKKAKVRCEPAPLPLTPTHSHLTLADSEEAGHPGVRAAPHHDGQHPRQRLSHQRDRRARLLHQGGMRGAQAQVRREDRRRRHHTDQVSKGFFIFSTVGGLGTFSTVGALGTFPTVGALGIFSSTVGVLASSVSSSSALSSSASSASSALTVCEANSKKGKPTPSKVLKAMLSPPTTGKFVDDDFSGDEGENKVSIVTLLDTLNADSNSESEEDDTALLLKVKERAAERAAVKEQAAEKERAAEKAKRSRKGPITLETDSEDEDGELRTVVKKSRTAAKPKGKAPMPAMTRVRRAPVRARVRALVRAPVLAPV